MPVEPNISLGASATGGAAAGGNALVINPLDTISKFATIQNQLNQNRLFQQTFEARTRAGQIIAGADSLDAGLKALFQDPQTAAFAGEIANSARQMENTMADIATKKQALAQSGVGFTLKGLAAALVDPSTLESVMGTGMATVDPLVAPEVRAAMANVVKGLGHGLPADPAAAQQMYRARLTGMLLSSGFTPEALHELTGTPKTVPGIDPVTGLRTEQGAVQRPAWAGGALSPSGPGVVGGMTPGEAITTHPGPVSSDLQPTQVTGGDIARGNVPGYGGLFPPRAVPGPGAAAVGPIGPNALGAVPAPAAAPGPGVPTAPAPGQTEALQGAAKSFTEEGKKAYESAQTGLASVQYMDRAFDELGQKGWETPGTAADARLQIAKGVNTLASVFGTDPKKLPFDVGKISSWEDLTKESQRATLQLVNQMFGASRESQMVVQGAGKAIPTVANTPQGGKLVLRSLEETMLREVDKRHFEVNWFNSHKGSLVGANEAFNSQFKPTLYSQRAISTVAPYEVDSPDQAAGYLPGTIVKRKSDGAVFRVTPQISNFKPIQLGQ